MIVLPYPPSANRNWRAVDGRVLLSRESRRYRDEVALIWRCARLQGYGRSLLKVRIDAYMPDSRRRDISNLEKVAIDSLQRAGAFTDDSQIIDLHIRRMAVDRVNPRIEVYLEAA